MGTQQLSVSGPSRIRQSDAEQRIQAERADANAYAKSMSSSTWSVSDIEINSIYRSVNWDKGLAATFKPLSFTGNSIINDATQFSIFYGWNQFDVDYYVPVNVRLDLGIAGKSGPPMVRGAPSPSDDATLIPAIKSWTRWEDPNYENTVKPYLISGTWRAPSFNCLIDIECSATCINTVTDTKCLGELFWFQDFELQRMRDDGRDIHFRGNFVFETTMSQNSKTVTWRPDTPFRNKAVGVLRSNPLAAAPYCQPIDPDTGKEVSLQQLKSYYCKDSDAASLC
ncbi:MAG: hypothetical protein AAGH88_07965 [Planctomycetota bacterium]